MLAKNCKSIGFHSHTGCPSWSVPPLQTERLRKMVTELKQSVVVSGPEPTAPAPQAHSAGPKFPCSGPGQLQMTMIELCSAEWGRLPRNTVHTEMACGGVWGQSHSRRAMKTKSQRQRKEKRQTGSLSIRGSIPSAGLVQREPAQGWGGRRLSAYTWPGSIDLHKASFQPRLIHLQMGTLHAPSYTAVTLSSKGFIHELTLS